MNRVRTETYVYENARLSTPRSISFVIGRLEDRGQEPSSVGMTHDVEATFGDDVPPR